MRPTPRVLLPWIPAEAITVAEAAAIARRGPKTIREWAARHDIGRPVVGLQWMTEAAPLWREITTDDYAPRIYPDTIGGAAWIASADCVRELLKEQHAGLYRVRLVLREAVDFQPQPNRRPEWFWHYSSGPSLVISLAKIVIERKTGRRVRVEL